MQSQLLAVKQKSLIDLTSPLTSVETTPEPSWREDTSGGSRARDVRPLPAENFNFSSLNRSDASVGYSTVAPSFYVSLRGSNILSFITAALLRPSHPTWRRVQTILPDSMHCFSLHLRWLSLRPLHEARNILKEARKPRLRARATRIEARYPLRRAPGPDSCDVRRAT